MKRIKPEDLDKIALKMPPGYKEKVMSRARVEGGLIILEDADFIEIHSTKGLLRQSMAAGKAVKDEAMAVANGQPPVEDAEFERRKAICAGTGDRKKCEYYLPDKVQCMLCGCNMDIKPRMRTQHCPIAKW